MTEIVQRYVIKANRNNARHASIRREVLRRAKWACEVCGFKCARIGEVHHIIPAACLDGRGTPDNLIFLCPNCHAVVEKAKSDFFILGWASKHYTNSQINLFIALVFERAYYKDDGWEIGVTSDE